MLTEFQQALADLVAAPEFCRQVRANPCELRQRYDLSYREYARIVAMVNHRGMALNCMLYRANRLAPLVLNLPRFCRAMGPRLGPLLSEYSVLHPNTKVHFYLECERFGRFVLSKIGEGYDLEPHVRAIFEEEFSKIKPALFATYTAI